MNDIRAAWSPQPGPQLDAINATWCDEILFGGARGGGKSDFLLGDFLQDVETYKEAWSGVIFRRTVPELDDLKKRSHQIYPQTGAKWQEQKGQWIWPNKAVLRMRHLERTFDAEKYRGMAFCVGVDTPILMGNGSSRRIVDIEIGDEVMTLSGPKRVTDKIEPYEADCVEASNRFGVQVHPVNHPILTDLGWRSYASILGIDAKEFEVESLESHKLPSVNIVARLLGSCPGSRRYPQHSDSSTRYRAPYRLHELFEQSSLMSLRPLLRKFEGLKRIFAPFQQTLDRIFLQIFFDGAAYGLPDPRIILGSRFDYLSYLRFYDERLQLQKESDLSDIPLPGDVEGPFRTCHKQDEEGGIRGYSQSFLDTSKYLHPYTDQVLKASEESFYEVCQMTPTGKRLVTDITVADANHYVNANSFLISKNTWIGWDELTQWITQDAYMLLRACLRSPHYVPTKRIRASANPGGPGHQWVKEMFVDPYPLGSKPIDDPVTKSTRMFIRSNVQDNQILLQNDPDYVERLKGVGSPELVRAWLEGDWNVVTGAFFPEFKVSRHVVMPCGLPKEWTRFRAFDWGSAAPFCVLWFAVSDGKMDEFPKNALIIYREWYGSSGPNKGLRLNADEIARGILKRDGQDNVRYMVMDPAIWKQDSGPSIAEEMRRHGAYGRPADNARISGWNLVRQYLNGQDGRPMLYIFSTCPNLIRTLPLMQHDENKAEDLDTLAEDHAVDTLRYGCMSRPYVSYSATKPGKIRGMKDMTLNELWEKSKVKSKEVRY